MTSLFDKLSVSLVDFFGIIIPGALLAFFFELALGHPLASLNSQVLGESGPLALFLIIAYISGHFAYLIGSIALDGWYKRIETARDGNSSAWKLTKLFANGLRSRNVEQALGNVRTTMNGVQNINAYQWSKARLSLEHPAALLEVRQIEAHSKFFRSLAVILPPVGGILCYLTKHHAGPSFFGYIVPTWSLVISLSLVLFGLSLWRFAEQRAKAVERACGFIITLDSRKTAK